MLGSEKRARAWPTTWPVPWPRKPFLPVIGVPLTSGGMGGLDALLSTVQMPPGIPVATVAVDNPSPNPRAVSSSPGVAEAQLPSLASNRALNQDLTTPPPPR
jgi:hypothetical protein